MSIAGESLIDIFSSLSQKRRNGVLRVVSGGSSCDLCFVDGRIAQIVGKNGEASNLSIRLARAGLLNEKVFQLVQNKGLSVVQLYELLVGKKFISLAQFQRAKVAHDMDVLHGLGMTDDVTFEFAARDVRPDPRFAASVSAGQLLLDYCELQADDDRFRSHFPDPKAVIARNGTEEKVHCDFEQAVWDLLDKPRRLEDLFCGVVSEYDLKEGLLVLFDRGLLSIGGSAEHPAIRDDAMSISTALPEEKQDLWHRIADQAVGAILEEFHGDLGMTGLNGDGVPGADTGRNGHTTPEVTAAPAATPDHCAPAVHDAESDAADVGETFDLKMEHPAVTASSHGNPARAEKDKCSADDLPPSTLPGVIKKFFRTAASKGIHSAFFETNHLFLEKSMHGRIMLVTVLAFLVSLLLISAAGSGLVEGWFRALAEFTSDF